MQLATLDPSPSSSTKRDAPRYVAGIDLGSNTFCLVVARAHGAGAGFRTVDVLKERVALMNGVDPETGELARATLDRALAVVRRFGTRVRAMPGDRVRAVGTSALRVTPGLAAFRQAAADALGTPIDIVDGPTEAALVFTGVAYGGSSDGRRLVVDLGGGSTECAIGDGMRADVVASLPYGHLERTRRVVERGRFDPDEYDAARDEVVEGWRELRVGWSSDAARFERAVGTGGTIRAIHKVTGGDGVHLERRAVVELEEEIKSLGEVDAVDYDGLSERRRATFVGGVLAVSAFLEALGVERMEVARHGLRDGVVHALLGNSTDMSLRHLTVERMERRYGVDTRQGERVRGLVTDLARQHGDVDASTLELVQFAARLHEIGQAVRYSGYHKEGGRILRRSEMQGFAADERLALAALVRLHRPGKKLKRKHWRRVSRDRRAAIREATLLLRLAVLLRRARVDEPCPFELEADREASTMTLRLPRAWLRDRPLEVADLEREARKWRQRDEKLEVRFDLDEDAASEGSAQ